MTKNDTPVRLPAEWENQDAVILSWPHLDTDWAYMLDAVTECFVNLALSIQPYARVVIVCPDPEVPKAILSERIDRSYPPEAALAVKTKFMFLSCQTNDTWARDFGYICTVDDQGKIFANDFKFNGWGLKFPANHDNLINTNILHSGIAFGHDCAAYVNRLNFVLEGGSIDSDGNGTIITTSNCLLSPNRNGEYTTKDEITGKLAEFFGCRQVVWLDHGALMGDDTDSHVDTLARFLPGGIIAYTSCDRPEDCHYHELCEMEHELQTVSSVEHLPYRLLPLPIPMPKYDEDGNRLPATYANFLLINGALLLPVYGDAHYDAIAIDRLAQALPGWDIVPVDCSALIQQHGSLHCVTMQIPYGVFKQL